MPGGKPGDRVARTDSVIVTPIVCFCSPTRRWNSCGSSCLVLHGYLR
ncbi:MAG: hypothetical protein MZU79_00020 [Anaerotruncus sp.]|nr:hypothetical protein [Anaerotruncus sp.]